MRILAVNIGSTSTKLAVYNDESAVFEDVIRHDRKELAAASDETAYRRDAVLDSLEQHGVSIDELSAVAARGGLMHPLEGGTYAITDEMLNDLASGRFGVHASNMSAPIAKSIADMTGIPAYIADPVVVDELSPLARLSGYKGADRISIFHALNQRAMALEYAASVGKRYDELNLIVAHMGGGVSVAAHERGRVTDVFDALCGEGAYSAERAGGIPVKRAIELCFSGRFDSAAAVISELTSNGGLMGYTGTNDGRELARRIDAGDEDALLYYQGMAYQIAKDIGAMAAVLKGNVDAIILTGGFAYDRLLTGWISDRVSFIAPVKLMPGEDECRALCMAVRRVLTGQYEAKKY